MTAVIMVDGKEEIDGKEGIAHVVERSDAENNVVDGTHPDKTKEIEHGLAPRQTVVYHVYDGHRKNKYRPHGTEKDRQQRRHREGIERGVVIEMPPSIRGKELDACIECGGSGHGECEQSRIETVDIVDMNEVGIATQQGAYKIGGSDDADNNEEDEQVCVGERRDKLRDGVVGYYGGQQSRLLRPTKRVLVFGKLYPYGIRLVVGHDADVGYYEVGMFGHNDTVGSQSAIDFFGLLAEQYERIGLYDEIVVVRVVMRLGKRQ